MSRLEFAQENASNEVTTFVNEMKEDLRKVVDRNNPMTPKDFLDKYSVRTSDIASDEIKNGWVLVEDGGNRTVHEFRGIDIKLDTQHGEVVISPNGILFPNDEQMSIDVRHTLPDFYDAYIQIIKGIEEQTHSQGIMTFNEWLASPMARAFDQERESGVIVTREMLTSAYNDYRANAEKHKKVVIEPDIDM